MDEYILVAVKLLFFFSIHILTALMTMYSYDLAVLPGLKLKMPSLEDISFSDDANGREVQKQLEEYSKEVVCPAYNYFRMASELTVSNRYHHDLSYEKIFVGILVQALSLGPMLRELRSQNFFGNTTACILAMIALCSLGCFIAYKVYKRNWALQQVGSSPEERLAKARDYCESRSTQYSISLDKDINNTLIFWNSLYLSNISASVRLRREVKVVLISCTVFAYLIFGVPFAF